MTRFFICNVLLLTCLSAVAENRPFYTLLAIHDANYTHDNFENSYSASLALGLAGNQYRLELGLSEWQDARSGRDVVIKHSPLSSIHGLYTFQKDHYFVEPGIGLARYDIEARLHDHVIGQDSDLSPEILLRLGVQQDALKLFASIRYLDDISGTSVTRYGAGIAISF